MVLRVLISRKTLSGFIATAIFCLMLTQTSNAQVISDTLSELNEVGIVEHLGGQVPLDLKFRNHAGTEMTFGEYFNSGQPNILVMHYSDCPMLCSMVLNGLSNSLKELGFVPGREYGILTVSVDPKESTERCQQTQNRYADYLKAGSTDDAWTFFTGDQTSIDALTESIGFNYNYLEDTGEFAHTAAIFILTETGVISRYLYGIEFKERDLRLALLEASEGKIGTTVDRVLLYCYQYDPDANGYVAMASSVLRLAGGVTVLGLILLISTLKLKDTANITPERTEEKSVEPSQDV